MPRVHVWVFKAPCKEALIELVLVKQPRIIHACWTAPAAAALARALHDVVAAAGFKKVVAAAASIAAASIAAGIAALVVRGIAHVFNGSMTLSLVLP